MNTGEPITVCKDTFNRQNNGSAYSESIVQIVKERKIDALFHFTQLSNLEGILKYGIYPRTMLDVLPYPVAVNDNLRLDERPDSVSLSLGHPNHSMFFKYRMLARSQWVVLIIDPSVLWESDCAFCKRNAAKDCISRLPLEALTGSAALNGMFDELDELPSRSEERLRSQDPTDHQAEVMVFDIIASEKIKGVIFQDNKAANYYMQKNPIEDS